MPEEHKKKWWKQLAEEMGVAAIGDAVVVGFVLPWLKQKLSGQPITEQEKLILAKAHEHFKKGERDQAIEELKRLPFGFGKYDEQMFDEDLLAATGNGPNQAPENRIRNLERWLDADLDRRAAFRNSLTLQNKQPERRVALIAEYARLDDAQRNTRLTAVGKMDPEEAEQFLFSLCEVLADRFHDINTWLAGLRQRRRSGWFMRVARFVIR
ncbi:MAG: hypothetical protein P4L74_00140 [Candidatus Doudnabacteria bacterium]|nr:hypothetical protein [Candidatus Doudnabacteria bacterium]